MRAPPPDLSRLGAAIVGGGVFLVGAALPLIGSAMIPNGYQRWGAAIFCLIGIGFFMGLADAGSTPFNTGLGVGFTLAACKLATGLRFL